MKRKPEELSSDDRKQTITLLVTAAADAFRNNKGDEFLKGLLTHSEQIMLGRRIWIARMLLEGKRYDQIGEKLHVGPNTIQRTELWLQGLLPNYEKLLTAKQKKSEEEKLQKNRKREVAQNPFGLTALKMKYPLHFLLFPWPKL
jgi:Trp operon repressor